MLVKVSNLLVKVDILLELVKLQNFHRQTRPGCQILIIEKLQKDIGSIKFQKTPKSWLKKQETSKYKKKPSTNGS